ncbi:hypothetical protein K466DRAFT_48969 [Polyporus arcularius HHB13444]|uniref:Uncharacterized protein n=1 Tax=Polyporus arcularius HHB13444 TaxID=1314778 RepID=A0A5C3PYK3_9APHY|nr:hypothetical protein K466DRAFT_48969 [Polyporus arcularius HHB13444]
MRGQGEQPAAGILVHARGVLGAACVAYVHACQPQRVRVAFVPSVQSIEYSIRLSWSVLSPRFSVAADTYRISVRATNLDGCATSPRNKVRLLAWPPQARIRRPTSL